MKSLRNMILTCAIAAALPAFAQSQPPEWYMGAGIGQGHFGVSGTDLTGIDNAQVQTHETTYSVRGGWRFSPYAALEAGYYDLGKYRINGNGPFALDGSAKATSYGLSLVGILPMDMFDLYARVGYAHSQVKVNASANLVTTSFNSSDTHDEATYGVGGRWNFNPNWGLFAEWMKNDKIKVDSYLVGLDYRF
ncbi:MAG: porin family protein [Usitatibacter sp.]